MSQQTFAEASFEQYRKPTRRERFLAEMEQVIPWSELAAVIEPYYPKAEGAGRPPVGGRANAPYPFPATLVQSV
jgi:IS5 family transposase